jgi:hypothetical protein
MSEQGRAKTAKSGKKNRYRFNNQGNQATKTSYKSKVAELEDGVFDVGASSDPAKFSKSLKSIENCIQKNYKTCNDIVKAIQHLKHPTLDYLRQPMRAEHTDKEWNLRQGCVQHGKVCLKRGLQRNETPKR